MEHGGQTFLSFWTFFYPFTQLTTTLKIKILKKLKNTPEDIIILQMYPLKTRKN